MEGPSQEPGKQGNTRLLQGAALLAGAALVSKVIGTLQKIPLQNLAGDHVFGIYNAVYPFYQLLLFMASAGIPVAISMLVSEAVGRGDAAGGRRIASVGMVVLGAIGALACVLMWGSAELAAWLIGDAEAAPAIRASAWALLFVPVMAALRGYFQGLQQMGPAAMSQVGEQLSRVAAMLLLLAFGLEAGWPGSQLAAGATAGSAAGGAAGLAIMLAYWARARRGEARQQGRMGQEAAASGGNGGREPFFQVARKLLRIAGAVVLGSIMIPILGIVDTFTVPRLLGLHMGTGDAMEQFGLYSRGQPLVQLVAMVAGAAAGALVPALVAARARRGREEIAALASMALRLAWWIGAAATVGLVMLAEPINMMLYGNTLATGTFALLGCTALAGTLSTVAAALLQGLGQVRLPALLLLLAAVLKAALNALLVPPLGIAGAALAGVAALTAAALLAAASAWRTAAAAGGAPAPGRARYAQHAGTALFALACMAAALWAAERGVSALLGAVPLPARAAAAVLALAGTAAGAAVFGAALLRAGGIGAREWRALPGGGRLAARLRRLRLVPPAAVEPPEGPGSGSGSP